MSASSLHPLVAADPELVSIADRLAALSVEFQAQRSSATELLAAWQRESDRAVLEGREAPPAPVVPDEQVARRQLRNQRQALERRMSDRLVELRDAAMAKLEAREREILTEVAEKVYPLLQQRAEEIGLLGRTAQQLQRAGSEFGVQYGPDGRRLATPRTGIDVDELFWAARSGSVSFLAGHAHHTSVAGRSA